MGSTPSPPPVADPGGVSAGQFEANLAGGESAQAGSQVNQYTPTGSLVYEQTGVGPNGVPTYSAVQELTPAQQTLLNLQQYGMGLSGGEGTNLLSTGFDQYSQNPIGVIGTGTSGISGQMMSGYLQQMQPFFTTQTSQLDTKLRNQGLSPTPTANPKDPSTWGAYENSMYQLQQSQANSVAGAAAQFQPQAFQEASSLYTMPAQLGMALSGYDVPGNVGAPETGQAPQYAPPNVIGAQANAQQAQEFNYQQQMLNQEALFAGLMGIGSAAIGKGGLLSSSRKLKRNLKPTKHLKHLNLQFYRWQYLWSDEWFEGPMAEDVLKICPDMVRNIGGILHLVVPEHV